MPQYAYRAKRDVTTEARGIVEAHDRSAAILSLKAQGLSPLDVTPITPEVAPIITAPVPGAAPRGAGRRLAPAFLALWGQTLAQGLHGGLTLTKALHLLAEQEGARPLGVAATRLRDLVSQGQPLSRAMTEVGGFSPVAMALVQAGEASGSLEQALRRIADSAERQAELRSKIQAALAYPSLILGVGLLTISGMIVFVVPKLTALFTEMGQTLPLPTRLMLGLRTWVGPLMVILAVAVVGLRVAMRRPAIHAWVQDRLARGVSALPVVGPVVQQAELAQWGTTLGLMAAQGVPLPRAVALANAVIGQPGLKRRFARLETDIVEGVPLSESLRRSGVAAPLLITMTAIGEAEGALDQSLLSVAGTFERNVDHGVKVISSLLEPVMILGMGLVVAAIVFSMLLPIFEINFTGAK